MTVVVEAVSVLDTALDAPYGKVHPCHTPGGVVGLLTVDGDVAPCLSCRFPFSAGVGRG